MKSVMLSIQPKYCELIASGKKTIEVRKSVPKLGIPFKCYIYETKNGKRNCKPCKDKLTCMLHEVNGGKGCYKTSGKVIGEFVCDNIGLAYWTDIDGEEGYLMPCLGNDCLSYEELCNYGKGDDLYLWHISDLKIYDKPKELSEFRKEIVKGALPIKIIRPPQSWGYVEELEK